MEELLEDQVESGNKVFWLIGRYTELTVESGQAHQAARFLPDYIEELLSRYRFPETYEIFLYECLHTIYESDGDMKRAHRVEKKLESLKSRVKH